MLKRDLISILREHFSGKGVSPDRLEDIMMSSLNVPDFFNSVCEAFRVSSEELGSFLVSQGFGDIVSRARASDSLSTPDTKGLDVGVALSPQPLRSPFPEIFTIECSPGLESSVPFSSQQHKLLTEIVNHIQQTASQDIFFKLYREDVCSYHDRFLETDGKLIDAYLQKHFTNGYPRYVVSSGIGANEQWTHFMAMVHNKDVKRRCTWIVIDSPVQLDRIPQDATKENTVFLEFSRSGETQETVKTHEFTSRDMKRIVFTNNGPLFDLGKRDGNLILGFPDAVPGRFGRNITPIMLAPLYVVRQDTKKIWASIQEAINRFNPALPDSLPLQLAQFVYVHQRLNRVNHCYVGSSGDEALLAMTDELVPLWNEGVNKEGNDMLMCRYFGQPRDSHTVIEGILANRKTKMAIFLMHKQEDFYIMPKFVQEIIDPINPDHAGLRYGQDDFLLAQANYERFKECMPVIKIEMMGDLSYGHGAILGQLWQDFVACYAKILDIDPGSNPEVRVVRDRSEEILARGRNL